MSPVLLTFFPDSRNPRHVTLRILLCLLFIMDSLAIELSGLIIVVFWRCVLPLKRTTFPVSPPLISLC